MSPGGVGLVACYRGITMVSHMVTGVTLDIYFFVPPFREDMELFTTHRIAGCYRCHMHNFAKGQPMSTPCNFAAYQARVTNHLARVYPTGVGFVHTDYFYYLFFFLPTRLRCAISREQGIVHHAPSRAVSPVWHTMPATSQLVATICHSYELDTNRVAASLHPLLLPIE